MRLVKGGTISGNDNASGYTPGTTAAWHSYGGSADLWGLTLAYSDINASTFGVVVSYNLGSGGGVGVDAVRITVTYSTGSSYATVVAFNTSGAGHWVAPSVLADNNNAVIEIWGAGGGGGGSNATTYGSSGGGGGAYTRLNAVLTPGTNYQYLVGAGGGGGANNANGVLGGNSGWNNNQITAGGGARGNRGATAGAPAGGLNNNTNANASYPGGASLVPTTTSGQGGGGAAGNTGAGHAATSVTGGAGNGTGTGAGGSGGNGGATAQTNGNNGLIPGGGGGGGGPRTSGTTGHSGGAGANGTVQITYTAPVHAKIETLMDTFPGSSLDAHWTTDALTGRRDPERSPAIKLTQSATCGNAIFSEVDDANRSHLGSRLDRPST